MEGLGTSLRKLLEALDGGVQAHYDVLGVPFRPRFYPVARLLRTEGPLSIKALSEATGVSHSAVSQTVAEMRRAGLAESSPGRDGREREVCLTETGSAVCDRLEPVWAAAAQAAAELDRELTAPLGGVVREALARLRAHTFSDRMSRYLERAN